jgi:hypothetical protein
VPAWPSIRGEDVGRSLAEMAQRDLDAALQLLADRAQFITGATGAAIALRRNGMNDMLCRASTGANAPELGAMLSTEFGLSGESVRTKQLLRCDDAERDTRVNREVCRQQGIASVVVMPVVHDDEVLGVFELFSGKTNAFGERDLSAVQRLGGMVETAVRLAHVTENLPEKLRTEESSIGQALSPTAEEQILDEEILAVEDVAVSGSKALLDSPPACTAMDLTDLLEPAKQTAAGHPGTVAVGSVAAAFSEKASTELPHVSQNQAGLEHPLLALQNAVQAAAPRKPLLWSVAESGVSAEKSVETDESNVPPVLRGLRKCEACGFPISGGRTLCVECEEKKWRGQLRRPQSMPTGAIPQPPNSKTEVQAFAAAAPFSAKPFSLSATAPARQTSVLPAPAAKPKESSQAASQSVSPSPAPGSAEPEALSSSTAAAAVSPAFVLSAGLGNSQSWISANKYVIGVLALIALLSAAFLLLR